MCFALFVAEFGDGSVFRKGVPLVEPVATFLSMVLTEIRGEFGSTACKALGFTDFFLAVMLPRFFPREATFSSLIFEFRIMIAIPFIVGRLLGWKRLTSYQPLRTNTTTQAACRNPRTQQPAERQGDPQIWLAKN
eukprot:4103337-Pyramimonas_sp.AAC.1